MPDLVTTNEYGRRKWNTEEYAKRARTRHHEAPKEKQAITNRNLEIDFHKDLNKVQLVLEPSALVHRGKSSGFYCETCNLTFKDNLTFLNHLNSSRHLENSEYETKGLNRNITVEDVRKKIELVYQKMLAEKEKENDLEVYNLKKRIELREQFDKDEAEKKRRKKDKKKQRRVKRLEQGNEDSSQVLQQMGFGGFGSTKNQ